MLQLHEQQQPVVMCKGGNCVHVYVGPPMLVWFVFFGFRCWFGEHVANRKGLTFY
jgi:hypothetical protein